MNRVEDNYIFRLNTMSNDLPALTIHKSEFGKRIKILEKFNLSDFIEKYFNPKKFEIEEPNYYLDINFLTGSLRIKKEMYNQVPTVYFEKIEDERGVLKVLNSYINGGNLIYLKNIFIQLGYYNY